MNHRHAAPAQARVGEFGSSVGDMSWPLVSVVLITYRRVGHLRATVARLRATCNYPRLEWIVSDDGSPANVQREILAIPFDRYVMADRNEGLAANTNKGLLAARGEFILQLQDDWDFVGPPDFLQRAILLTRERPEVAMVQFWRPYDIGFPAESHRMASGDHAAILMDAPGMADSWHFYVYSDCPHLRTWRSVEVLGPYRGNRQMPKVEMDYMHRFEAQTDLRAALIRECSEIFPLCQRVLRHLPP